MANIAISGIDFRGLGLAPQASVMLTDKQLEVLSNYGEIVVSKTYDEEALHKVYVRDLEEVFADGEFPTAVQRWDVVRIITKARKARRDFMVKYKEAEGKTSIYTDFKPVDHSVGFLVPKSYVIEDEAAVVVEFNLSQLLTDVKSFFKSLF